jgi:hypothetical protein
MTMNGQRHPRRFVRDSFRILLLFIASAVISVPWVSVNAQDGSDRAPRFAGTPFTAQLCLRSSLPFVWVRTSPSSQAAVRETLYPADYAKVAMANGVGYDDGVQRWVQVSAFPTATRFFTGWIEQSALVGMLSEGDTCPGTVQPVGIPPHPHLPGAVRLKPGIPFAWQRSAPSSYAPVIDDQLLRAGMSCWASGSPFPMPVLTSLRIFYWDGVQWWVQIGHAPREYSARGWVEAASLEHCPS